MRTSDLEHLILNISFISGDERLVYIIKKLGYKIGIVSDEFDIIIDHIKQSFDVGYSFDNTLEAKNEEFTVHIIGEILDGHQKMCYPSGSCS